MNDPIGVHKLKAFSDLESDVANFHEIHLSFLCSLT